MIKKEVITESATTGVLMKAIKKKYGNVINPMSESGDDIKTVSTGSLGLDLALGRGGMALGRVYEVFGPNSSGKSTLGVHVIVQAQRRGLKCCFFDAERSADPELFESFGVDPDKLTMIKAFGGESNLDIAEAIIKDGSYQVIVIDSVSALIPMVEAESSIEDQHMALQARLMSKALRKITPQAAENNVLVIFINQTRNKVGGYGDPIVTQGGEALGFWASGRISVRGPESKARRIVDGVTGNVVGHTTIFEVVKNKLSEPFRKAQSNLIYKKGYDHIQEVLSIAVSLDLIEKAGSWFKYNGENIAQGELAVLDKLRSDKKLFDDLYSNVIELTGLGVEYERHSNPGPKFFGNTVS